MAQRRSNGPGVCPFVALAEDRNRRADEPDRRNRCYAEPAPRQRDLAYQAEYCYSVTFASCSVFLAWAARNAATPARVSDGAAAPWPSGASPEDEEAAWPDVDTSVSDATAAGATAPEGGLFAADELGEGAPGSDSEPQQLDWVSASAWAEVPWDEQAEAEADEFELLEEEPLEEDDELADRDDGADEATVGPKVPAALPMRRRRTRQTPIRTRGSGEWFYADPLDHEPIVKRRYGITPPILLGVLGLLVLALIVFMIPTLFFGGSGPQTAAGPSISPGAQSPLATRAPIVVATAAPSLEPGPTQQPKIRTYRVKPGDTLTGIAQKFGVKVGHLQCMNHILNKNVIQLGARYLIPPDGFTCPPNWRKGGTPAPSVAPEA